MSSGELLLDQQKFQESVERFDKSLELDKGRKPRNVLPLVNKALAIFQWKQDIAASEALCIEALDIDSECDVAVATLAQLSLQQGKIDDAIKWFEKSGKLARTEGELINAITCECTTGVCRTILMAVLDEHASRAQQAFLKVGSDVIAREDDADLAELPRVRREAQSDGTGCLEVGFHECRLISIS
jgi:import receptor subunit TOM70